jgi:hypothetical protein
MKNAKKVCESGMAKQFLHKLFGIERQKVRNVWYKKGGKGQGFIVFCPLCCVDTASPIMGVPKKNLSPPFLLLYYCIVCYSLKVTAP